MEIPPLTGNAVKAEDTQAWAWAQAKVAAMSIPAAQGVTLIYMLADAYLSGALMALTEITKGPNEN